MQTDLTECDIERFAGEQPFRASPKPRTLLLARWVETMLPRSNRAPICGLGHRPHGAGRKWRYRTDVDLAQDIAVRAALVLGSIEEIGVSQQRQFAMLDSKDVLQTGDPQSFHIVSEELEGAHISRVHDAWPRLRLGRVGPCRGWRQQRADQLVAETDDRALAHIAADHAVPEPGLERLVDEAFATLKIGCEPSDQGIEGNLERNAVPRGVKDRNDRLGATPPGQQFRPATRPGRHCSDFP